ncbi:MAG: type IV secretory system conjugative DNA transfer family protein, partial [Anditalea sp.]
LPQLKQLQGKDTATTMTAVIGNVLSGSVRNKETLEWLERMFGKRKQLGESVSIDRTKTSISLNEKYDPLIPAGKIAGMQTGELVGLLAVDAEKFNGAYKTANIHCRVSLDPVEIENEEKNYRTLPKCYEFQGKKEQVLTRNFMRIREEVENIIDYYTASA